MTDARNACASGASEVGDGDGRAFHGRGGVWRGQSGRRANHQRHGLGGDGRGASCVANAAADLLCGRGRVSRGEVAELTATPMLAWFWEQLVGQQQQQEVEDDVRREEVSTHRWGCTSW